MKRTYHRTMFHRDLREATVELNITQATKYEVTDFDTEAIRTTFKGVTAWDVIEGGAEAEEIEKDTDASGVDENHEYLVLHFDNGETATYRNSHVVMFIL